jgi:hypothetical protein
MGTWEPLLTNGSELCQNELESTWAGVRSFPNAHLAISLAVYLTRRTTKDLHLAPQQSARRWKNLLPSEPDHQGS